MGAALDMTAPGEMGGGRGGRGGGRSARRWFQARESDIGGTERLLYSRDSRSFIKSSGPRRLSSSHIFSKHGGVFWFSRWEINLHI